MQTVAELLALFREVDNVFAVGLHALVVFLRANNKALPIAQTCTCGDEVTGNNVLLHALELVHLTTYSCLVEHLSGLLERCRRDEALGLESGAGDTLQNLCRRCWDGVANLYETEVTALEA